MNWSNFNWFNVNEAKNKKAKKIKKKGHSSQFQSISTSTTWCNATNSAIFAANFKMAFKGRGASRRGRLKSKWRPRTDGLKQRWRAPVKGEATDQLINGRRWRMQPANNPRVGSGRPAPADRQPAGWPFFFYFIFFFYLFYRVSHSREPTWVDGSRRGLDHSPYADWVRAHNKHNTCTSPLLPLPPPLLPPPPPPPPATPPTPPIPATCVCVCSLWFKSIW